MAYSGELVALIKSGVHPSKAVKVADSHKGNSEEVEHEIAQLRANEKNENAYQNAYIRVQTAKIKNGEDPHDVVEDMKNFTL